MFWQHLACLGWWPHLAGVASGPDSNLVASAQQTYSQAAPETVELPYICVVIRRCPDHQYRGGLLPTALPATRTVGLDNPQTEIAPGTRYMVSIAIVFFFKFG